MRDKFYGQKKFLYPVIRCKKIHVYTDNKISISVFSPSGTHQSHHFDGCQAIGINSSFIWDFWALPFHCAIQWTSPSCHEQSSQGRSEGASSVAFEVLIVKSEIDFINLFIFNCLKSNINLFIFNSLTSNINLFNFNCLTSNFCFPKNIFFVYGRGSLVSGFQLNQENDDLLSSGHK